MKDKKKIGIVTFHNAHNYGAMLQVYALQTILSTKYDAQIINYRNMGIERTYRTFRINKKNILTRVKSLIAGVVYYRKDKKRCDIFNKFLNEKLKLTEKYNTEEELKLNPPKYDVYITGSDQVWNCDISSNNIEVYTLNFGDNNIRKISYAASMGAATLDERHVDQYINNIKKLDCISVREDNAKTYLEKLIDKDITVTLDPTLLMNKEDWKSLIPSNKTEKEKYIFAYILEDNEEFFKILNHLSKITGYKVIHASRRNIKIDNILRSSYSDGPIEFLKLIQDAEYVVATSFHATVFSVLFHKKFWVVPPKKTSSRITDLLKKLNIGDRAINSFEEFSSKDIQKAIEYDDIDKLLEKERKESLNWLEKAINNEKN